MDESQERHRPRVPYSKVKKAVMKCEIDKDSRECKDSLRELGITEE